MNNRRLFAFLLAFAFVFVMIGVAQEKSDDTAIDPVCGMTVNKAQAKATYEYKGTTYYFCNPGCKESFAKDPEKYLAKQASGAQTGMMGQGRMMRRGMAGGMTGYCPMMDKDVETKLENTTDGVTVRFTSKNPESVKKIQEHFASCQKMMKDSAQKEMPKVEKE